MAIPSFIHILEMVQRKNATKTSGRMNHLKNGKFGNAPDIDAGLTGRYAFWNETAMLDVYAALTKPFLECFRRACFEIEKLNSAKTRE